ncbi:unnamed protein product [Cladocopium goreaui]|uniref:Uncharacterized protein n=1 Tax=Cladocopium goreaui TaxID=2562237 RepID=A0A9P1C9U3_9DINO|nr:unnamed protein product [Cladocopium goreaui]
MCKHHGKRQNLNVPEWLQREWKNGDKNEISDVLRECNFSKEVFISTMQTIISKKQSMRIKKEEGWYSEGEMKNDLGWSTSKIAGAKTRCLAMPETHVRP